MSDPGPALSTSWDPGEYLRFAAERERAFDELVSRIATITPSGVVDLGCGPGTATRRLAERWPGASVTGIDSSPAMVAKASKLSMPGRLGFELAEISEWSPSPGSLDVITANAVLQWVPGHLDMLGRFAGALRSGGTLALQVPATFDQPIHSLIRRLVRSGRWPLDPEQILRSDPVWSPQRYLSEMLALGLQADVWESTYLHLLAGPGAVLAWARGTALRPVLSALGDPADAASFEEAYAEALAKAYPPGGHGWSVMPFRRIFAVGRRP